MSRNLYDDVLRWEEIYRRTRVSMLASALLSVVPVIVAVGFSLDGTFLSAAEFLGFIMVGLTGAMIFFATRGDRRRMENEIGSFVGHGNAGAFEIMRQLLHFGSVNIFAGRGSNKNTIRLLLRDLNLHTKSRNPYLVVDMFYWGSKAVSGDKHLVEVTSNEAQSVDFKALCYCLTGDSEFYRKVRGAKKGKPQKAWDKLVNIINYRSSTKHQ